MDKRLANLRSRLKEDKIDALLVSNFYNILYLTGFKGLSPEEREAWLIITGEKVYLITDGRYYDQVQISKSKLQIKSKIQIKLISSKKSLLQNLKDIINDEKIKRLGFESEDLKYSEYQKFRESMSVQLVSTEKFIITLRAIKDQSEISHIKQACDIGDQCFAQLIKTIKVGQTEAEIAWKIEKWLRENGSDLAFDPIVAIDQNATLPHYDTKAQGQTKTKKGSTILIDFGARYKDYMSDMTRMIFFGKPKNGIIKIYEVLLDAQQKAIKSLAKTSDSKEIDVIARNFSTYPHSTGHGLGLEIHENPKISSKSLDTIQKDQVFTIEPGIYLPGKFGMRIEDTIWMKDDLNPQILTKFPKDPIII